MTERPQPSTRAWLRRARSTIGPHVVAVSASAFALYPVIWIISAAFNADNTLSASRVLPRNLTLDNFAAIFDTSESPVGTWLWNSFVIGFVAAALNVLIAAFAAYSFSRHDFLGRRALLTSLLVLQIFPQFLGFIAFFVMAQQIGEVAPVIGLNTHAFLILVYIGGAAGFNAFLLKGFLDSIPKSLDEAARIDGAGQWTIFSRIIMPLARPMLAVIFMISFISVLSEFVLASFLLTGTDNLTLPVGLQIFLQQGFNARWGLLAATALVGAFPIVVIFVAAQRHIIGGLAEGSVKG